MTRRRRREPSDAFRRRLHAAAQHMGHLVRGDAAVRDRRVDWEQQQVTVVDIHNLHGTAQMFVVGVLLKRMMEHKEAQGTAKPLVFVVLDELNKYAPRSGWSPIQDVLLDIAERGRSLGVSLFGAQQTASEVERRVVANAALKVVGRLDAAEAERGEYGFLTRVARQRRHLPVAGHDDRVATRDPDADLASLSVPVLGHAAERSRGHRPGTRSFRPSEGLSDAHCPHGGLARRPGLEEPEPARRDGQGARSPGRVPPTEKIDLLLMAGDVFETSRPSAEAERLVFRFFRRIGQAGVQSVVIAGNHDSAARLEAWGMLAELVGVHTVGRPRSAHAGGLKELTTPCRRDGAGRRLAVRQCPHLGIGPGTGRR